MSRTYREILEKQRELIVTKTELIKTMKKGSMNRI